MTRLLIFAVVICALLWLWWSVSLRNAHKAVQNSIHIGSEQYKLKVAQVINAFHAYYGVWPSSPGPLGFQAEMEMMGANNSVINTKHINFFKQNDCDYDMLGEDGRPLIFQVNEAQATCTVIDSAN